MPAAAGLTIALRPAAVPLPASFNMGAARHPDGTTITADGRSLRKNDRPWTPVMGEFHFARYPASEWREELLKLKAGGIDVVATYVFWIHHEESEGSGLERVPRAAPLRRDHPGGGLAGDRALRSLVPRGSAQRWSARLAAAATLGGGGLHEVRSDHPRYLGKVRILYAEIARQLQGLLWKDGGPVVGVQLENEYSGPAQHLLTLKRLAREAGLDVPLYTRTGWPELQTPMHSARSSRSMVSTPKASGTAKSLRCPDSIGRVSTSRGCVPMPTSPTRCSGAATPGMSGRRPLSLSYLRDRCGMMSSYHRRIHMDPADVEATTLVKLGSGGNSLAITCTTGARIRRAGSPR